MSNNSRSFLQDFFTERFIKVYDALLALKDIKKKGDFAKSLNIDPYNLSHITKGERNYPVPLRSLALQILRETYGVDPSYFDDRLKSEMFLNGARKQVILPAATPREISQVEILNRRISELEALVAQKDAVISALQAVISAATNK